MIINFCIFLLFCVVSCEADVCRSSCESTYSNKVPELKACLTGCRISFITELSSGMLNNELAPRCKKDCDDGYQKKDLAAACYIGCQSHEAHKKDETPEEQEMASLLGFAWHQQLFLPFHHMGHYCSKLYRNAATFVVSSVDVNDGSDANTIIMKIDMQPRHMFMVREEETVRKDETVTKDEGSSLKRYASLAYQHGRKWLNCVEKRIGMPYWALVGVLFLSLFFMCWVCCSSCDDEREREDIKKHVFKNEMSVHAEPVAMEKPPPYFIVAEYDAGPLPEKLPLLD